MLQASFRFYAELNDFLPSSQRFQDLVLSFHVPGSVKDAVESFGIPHTEIDLVLVNGEAVDFSYRLRDGDRISVYPMFEALDISSLARLRERPLREPRFVLDTHLGQLARFLRLAGFDTIYANDTDDAVLARISREEHRVLLTRDIGLLKRGLVTHGHFVRSTDPVEQFRDVLFRMDLRDLVRPFSRCLVCNGELAECSLEERAGKVIPEIESRYHDLDFRKCRSCERIFWPGSHYDHMRTWLNEVLGSR